MMLKKCIEIKVKRCTKAITNFSQLLCSILTMRCEPAMNLI